MWIVKLLFFFHVLQDKRKDAVKKVIAAMTVGKDVSSLFTDVVNCMQTENLELKKLVYLYLINYAKSQPDLAILAVNTFVKVKTGMNAISSCFVVHYLFSYPSPLFICWHFFFYYMFVLSPPSCYTYFLLSLYEVLPKSTNTSVEDVGLPRRCVSESIAYYYIVIFCTLKSNSSLTFPDGSYSEVVMMHFYPFSFIKYCQDSQDPNPLIRALAVRTMGCIRVDKITEYLCDPLQRCLKVGTRHCYNLDVTIPVVHNNAEVIFLVLFVTHILSDIF